MTFTMQISNNNPTNTPWQQIETQWHVQEGLSLLAALVQEARGDDSYGSLVSNSGADPWEGEVFSLRAYCWCDGDKGGHDDGCPPNFEHHPSGLIVCWYKHVGRGSSQNRAVSVREWVNILGSCIREVNAVHP